MFEQNRIVQNIAVSFMSIVLGVAIYAYVDNCDGFSCSFTGTDEDKTVTIGDDQVSVTYTFENVGEAPDLAGGVDTNLPDDALVQLPIAVTSDAYIASFNDMLNAGNKLEVQVRERLPKALYAVQNAAMSGDMETAFDAIVTAQKEAQSATALNDEFKLYIQEFERFIGGAEQSVAAASRDMAAKGYDASASAKAFIDHATRLSEPRPPSRDDLDALGPLAEELNSSFETFALSVQDTYGIIKKASQ